MWIDIQQNTDEWLDLRAGKVTGSAISKIMANYGKAFGGPAKNLAVNLAVERSTGKRVETDNFKNAHMERGHQQEPVARMLYEDLLFVDVTNGGFHDNKTTGCSLDGIVSPNGAVEIKSVIPTTHYATVERGGYDPAYKWQYIFNMRESGCDWLDFISYCSAYPDENQLYVYRITKQAVSDELQQIEIRLEQFEDLIAEKMTKIKPGSYEIFKRTICPLHQTEAWKKYAEAREFDPVLAATMPEPTTEKQCEEAAKAIGANVDNGA